MLELTVSEDEPIVNIADVTDKETVVGQRLFESDGRNLLTDGNHHEAQCWREWTAHGATSLLADATIVQCKGLHIEGCSEEGWYGLDDDFTGDVELSKRTATYSPW